jgi:hypothetical protein
LHSVGAARVLRGLGDSRPRIVFTDQSTPSAPSSAGSPDTTPQLQINSSASQSVWGQQVEVYQLNANGSQLRLDCDSAAGSRYSCFLPSVGPSFSASTYRVVDINHRVDSSGSIGTLEAWTSLPECGDNLPNRCGVPLNWSMDTQVNSRGGAELGWNLTFQFVNVQKGDKISATLGLLSGSSQVQTDDTQLSSLTIPIDLGSLRSLTDNMPLKVQSANSKAADQTILVGNLASHLLPIADANSAWTDWTGTNLLSGYTGFQIEGGKVHLLKCFNQNHCQLDPSESLDSDKLGFIYLVSASNPPVLLREVVNGKTSLATYMKPKSPTGPGTPPSGGSQGAGGIVVNIGPGTIQTNGSAEAPPVTTAQKPNTQSP